MTIPYFLTTPTFFFLVIVLVIWELVWKGLAAWKAARNGHKTWFWVILILNTIGILPIIYLLFFSKKRKRKRWIAKITFLFHSFGLTEVEKTKVYKFTHSLNLLKTHRGRKMLWLTFNGETYVIFTRLNSTHLRTDIDSDRWQQSNWFRDRNRF